MLEKLSAFIKDHKGDQSLVITEQTTFSDLEFDSLETVELVMDLEEEFGVAIEMSENIKSVGDIITILENAQ